MTRLWITGESSFISRNFAQWIDRNPGKYEFVNRLENEKYDYFRNYSSGYKNYENEINIFDPTLKTLIEESGAEMIIHHAAVVGTDYCESNANNALETNINGTLKIIEVAKKLDLPLIFISTSVCYQPTEDVIVEDHFLEPQTIYGMSKLAGEHLLKTWMKNNYVTIIPAMLFGAYDLHSASNKLIMSGLNKITDTVNIFLDPDYDKPFMYIDNYLDAIDIVIQNFEKLNRQRINIAPDDAKPFSEVITYIEEKMGLPITYELFPKNDYLGPHVLSNEKLKKLGWTQKISLEEGLDKVRKLIEDA